MALLEFDFDIPIAYTHAKIMQSDKILNSDEYLSIYK